MIKFYEHQTEALKFIDDRKHVYLSLPPGGGKTLTALEATKNFQRILIICPASLCLLWRDEILKWYGSQKIQVVETGKSLILDNVKYIILSYEKAIKLSMYSQLIKICYEAVIVDEAHALKNPFAKRTEALMGWTSSKARLLTKKSLKKVLLLSGTPMMQRPIEIYSALRGLRPELLGEYKLYEKFGVHFAAGYRDCMKRWVFTGASNVEKLAKICRPFLFRVSRDRINQSLPPLVQQIIRLDCAEKLIAQEKRYDLDSLMQSHSVAFEGLAELRQLMALEKIPLVIEYIKNLRLSGENIIIFAWHLSVIEKLVEAFTGCLQISGLVPPSERLNLAKIFNGAMGQIIICQVKAASEGLSFHTASHVVFVEPSWNPAENEQAYKRAHRTGQKKSVTVHYMVANNSLDDFILRKVLTKEKTVDTFYNALLKEENING